jgi:hypothetical protein
MRRRAGHRIAVAMALVLVCLALPARGASVDDRDFARGPLDLKRLVATKHDATAPLHLTLVTYGWWDARLLDASGSNRIFFQFNPDSTGRPDFTGEVFFRDGVLWMRITERSGAFVRRIRAYHPERNVVRATVPRGLPNPAGQTWLAATERYVTATGPCADGCSDRIPDAGWLKVTPGL